MSITDGQPVADFSASATSDTTVTLSELRGTAVILYFYPRDSTPGCTTEGQDFRDAHPRILAAGGKVFGVSMDSMRKHENFKAKQDFPFELISDETGELCRQFDVIKLKKMYGKEFEGIERSTFLIDKDGVLQKSWRKVKVPGHVNEVVEALEAL